MVQIDENIKKQLDKPRTWFCKYFPKRIQNHCCPIKKRNKPIFNTNTTSYINFAKRGLSFCVV